MLNATYMALRIYSDIYILCIIVYTCDKYSMQYKLQIVQCDVYLIKKKSNIYLMTCIALILNSLVHATYVSSFHCDVYRICVDMPYTSHW